MGRCGIRQDFGKSWGRVRLQTFTISIKNYHLILCNYEWLGYPTGSIYMVELVNGNSFT